MNGLLFYFEIFFRMIKNLVAAQTVTEKPQFKRISNLGTHPNWLSDTKIFMFLIKEALQ